MPTLIPGDRLVADIRHPDVLPTYGDMAIFRNPHDPGVDYIKRVVGLPGDLVQLRQGVLYLNGRPIKRVTVESKHYRETLPNGRTYDVLGSDDAPEENTGEFKVPPDSFFVLGDNRDNSLDSRQLKNFGYVPAANVIGIAHTVFWTHDMSRLFSRIE
jgi:signal peptidase I